MSWDGKERRMNQDEQLGYIKGKVESMSNEIKEVKETVRDHIEQQDKHRDTVLNEIRALREEQSVYRHVWWTLKAVALTVAGVLTLKLGDILTIFKGLK